MKASESIAYLYKYYLDKGHRSERGMVTIVIANIIDDIELEGKIVSPEEIEDRLLERLKIHTGGEIVGDN